ncbi:MAG: hypothetical protein J6Y79_04570 [Paludibacteraceae bacterium]|nr:hypothetical protein [Paludibacteraceae bacterium]
MKKLVRHTFLCLSLFASFQASAQIESIPTRFDLRDSIDMYGARTQDFSDMTCWAYAATVAAEASLAYRGVCSDSLSVKHMVDNNLYKTKETTEKGNQLYAISYFSRGDGPVLATDESVRVCDLSELLLIPNKIDSIKWAVNKYGAVFSAACTNQLRGGLLGYYNSEKNSSYLSPDDAASYSISANHAVVIIGYDDNFNNFDDNPLYRPSAPGAWLVQNSNGAEWGDRGCAWISYESAFIGESAAVFSASTKALSDTVFQYNDLNATNYLSAGTDSLYSVTFFTASDEALRTSFVGVDTRLPDTHVEVEIIPGSTLAELNESDPLVKKDTLFALPGFHLIPVSTDLTPGDDFAVNVLQYVATDVVVSVATEDLTKRLRPSSAPSGKQYLFTDTGKLYEFPTSTRQRNLCQKLYAFKLSTTDNTDVETDGTNLLRAWSPSPRTLSLHGDEIDSAALLPIHIYNVSGHLVTTVRHLPATLSLPQGGVYIVLTPTSALRVFVSY